MRNVFFFLQILDTASKVNPQVKCVWEEKIILNKTDDKKMVLVLQEASKVLKSVDVLHLWNLTLENINSKDTVRPQLSFIMLIS